MRYQSLFIIGLMFCAGCKQNTKKNDPQPSANNTIAATDTLPYPQPSDPSTFPLVWLNTDLTNVVLRDTPSIKGNNIGYFDHLMQWTGQISKHKDVIPVRGVAKAMPWYRLHQYGWVYGGCVYPTIMDFAALFDSTQNEKSKHWAVLERLDSATFFKKLIKNNKKALISPVDTIKEGVIPKMTILGRDTFLKDYICSCEGYRNYYEFKETPNWYYYSTGGWEWGDCTFVRKKDGKTSHSHGCGGDWYVSSDGQFCLDYTWQGYGEKFSVGLEFFDFVNWRFTAINLLYEHEDASKGDMMEYGWGPKNEILFCLKRHGVRHYFQLKFAGVYIGG